MVEATEKKELDSYSVFYEPRIIPKYQPDINENLLKLAFDLKEKRKTSVEGLLYLVSQENDKHADQLLSGEKELIKKEKEKYIKYLLQKHQRWLPKELTKNKLPKYSRKAKKLSGQEKKDIENPDKPADDGDGNLPNENNLIASPSEDDLVDPEAFDDEDYSAMMDEGFQDQFEDNEGERGGEKEDAD